MSATSESNFHVLCQVRSEEHTSELQSRLHLVCRLLLEKKKSEPIHTLLSSSRLPLAALLPNVIRAIALICPHQQQRPSNAQLLVSHRCPSQNRSTCSYT